MVSIKMVPRIRPYGKRMYAADQVKMSFQSLHTRRLVSPIPCARVDLPDFEIVLHLGQVEVRSESSFDGFECVVEKVETKVKHGAGQGFSVDDDSGLVEVPSSRSGTRSCQLRTQIQRGKNAPNEEHGRVLLQLVRLAVGFVVNLAPIRNE